MGIIPGKAAVPVAVRHTSRPRIVHEPRRFLSEQGSDLTPEQIDFMMALDRFKRKYYQPHPTSSQVLGVVHAMGYRRVASAVEA